jgi:hypothetical protein
VLFIGVIDPTLTGVAYGTCLKYEGLGVPPPPLPPPPPHAVKKNTAETAVTVALHLNITFFFMAITNNN